MPPHQPIRATRGVRDILPADRPRWRHAEQAAIRVAESFGYQQIETPILEPVELIERGVGGETDIVSKELYKFNDRDKRWLVLRPEGTAGTVRAYFEGNLNQGPQPARLYLIGPMFRHDKPQAGRYRQLYQFNLEAIGDGSPALDAEVVEVAWTWYREIGLKGVTLQLNSVGDAVCRPAYRAALLAYLEPIRDRLSADSRRRVETNPLRVLDSKEDLELLRDAPLIGDHLCEDCRHAFDEVQGLLREAGVEFSVNPRIVRGLDYYTRTAFEFWHTGIGSQQNALGGGGRYDGLASDLGWPSTPGVGFAAGLDRTVAMLEEESVGVPAPPAADVVVIGDGVSAEHLALVGRICRAARSTAVDYSERSLTAKMRSANRVGARWVALMNAAEAGRNVVQLKEMGGGGQQEVAWSRLDEALR
ncbi:MAG TPA: histidine--tRNA ligase [Candidatus Dormibacteraeota bacterium]|nr:histidine--tRNA ligase [Candidatus Dormibacteraeota bacterium]